MTDSSSAWKRGFHDGVPIAMGYYAVAFSLGIIAATSGLSALSVALYGMFLAIIVPPAKKDRAVLWCIVVFLCSLI